MKHCPNPSALFGDLELAIDLMLNGDPTVKHQVALADQKDHGGYQTLINAMRRIGVNLQRQIKSVCYSHYRVIKFIITRSCMILHPYRIGTVYTESVCALSTTDTPRHLLAYLRHRNGGIG